MSRCGTNIIMMQCAFADLASTFPVNRSGFRCFNLFQSAQRDAIDAVTCAARCCQSHGCVLWQYRLLDGCWLGWENQPSSVQCHRLGGEDWTGAARRGARRATGPAIAQCANDARGRKAFPNSQDGVQCQGLTSAGESDLYGDLNTAESCAAACCYDATCSIWQYHVDHGCWHGDGRADLSSCAKTAGWVGGDRGPLLRHPRSTAPTRTAAVALLRNEGPRLREWLAFHPVQGIGHFYLIDDQSTDNPLSHLGGPLHRGLVTILPATTMTTDAPVAGALHTWQSNAYTNILLSFGRQFKWLAVIDVDEFLYATDGTPLSDALDAAEAKYGSSQCASVCIPSEVITSMGLEQRDPQTSLVTQTFTNVMPGRQRWGPRGNPNLKCIARSDGSILALGPHQHLPRSGLGQCTSYGEAVTSVTASYSGVRSIAYANSTMRLNHYYHMSRQEFLERLNMSRWKMRDSRHPGAWSPDIGEPQRPGLPPRLHEKVQGLLREWALLEGRLSKNEVSVERPDLTQGELEIKVFAPQHLADQSRPMNTASLPETTYRPVASVERDVRNKATQVLRPGWLTPLRRGWVR